MKVVGQLRVFNSKLSLSIHHMQPIFNANEITDHFLSCISCYLYYKKRSSVSILIHSSSVGKREHSEQCSYRSGGAHRHDGRRDV